MHIIIGLGNPGKQYEKTRHNVGFLFLDFLRDRWKFPPFSEEPKFQSELSRGLFEHESVLLLRPTTFMNRSGTAVQSVLSFYKIPPKNIAVVHDDLDIPIGSMRPSPDSRSAGHNGVEDIIEKLGTKTFLRFRIGIGPLKDTNRESKDDPDKHQDASLFVLEKFSSQEQELVTKTFPDIEQSLVHWRAQTPL